MQGRDGDCKAFELRLRDGGDAELPCAHTCFNRIDLPVYKKKEDMARYSFVSIASYA